MMEQPFVRKRTSFITDYMEPTQTIRLPRDTEVTERLIEALLKTHTTNCIRYQKLWDYFVGKAEIRKREKDAYKSNNRLVLDYPSYIVDIMQGLLLGRPITYTTGVEHKANMEKIQEVFDINDEQDENTELSKLAGIMGRAYEVVYIDEDKQIRFNEVRADEILFVKDDKINPDPLMALYIRQKASVESVLSSTKERLITVYTADRVYEFEEEGGNVTLISEELNPFGQVNVIEYMNNDEGIGDFERVLTLIDAMNLINSDMTNDFEEFADAILVLSGMPNTNGNDISLLMQDRALLLEEGQGAKWLIKDINEQAITSYKTSLNEYIHKFAKVPDLSDENFAGNISGEAMKFKLFGTDQIISQKKRKMKTALVRRLELICYMLKLKGQADIDYKTIEINFNDNKPYNELENVQMATQLKALGASREFVFSSIKNLENVENELAKQDEETAAYVDLLGGHNDVSRDREDLQEDTQNKRQTDD